MCRSMLGVAAAGLAMAGPWAHGQAASSPRAGGGARFVAVLDAAHGGDDSGARLDGTTVEKTVTLAMSVRLRSLLMARGIAVVTTREGNVNLDSDSRAQIANRAVAAGGVCLSLHASEAGSGVHIFVSSLSATGVARFLPWKTAQSGYVTRSLRLAGVINSAMEHTTMTGGDAGDAGTIPATLGRASLPGVDSMTCPAVAIEVAPIRGADRKTITEVSDADYQTRVVEALAAALMEWKADLETGQEEPRSEKPEASAGQTP